MFYLKKHIFHSQLFDQTTFYDHFVQDLRNSQLEVIIESPFVSASRMSCLYPVLKDLISRKILIFVVTRDPVDYDNELMRDQATNEILKCNELGIRPILLTGHHHRKLAMIDRKILWEGSLNILSFNNSQEIMRRIDDRNTAGQMFDFLKLKKLLSQRES